MPVPRIAFALTFLLITQALPAQTPPTLTASDGSKMVLVPAGPFIMGTGEGFPDEAPPHRIDLPAFYIDACEVTNTQYAAFLKATNTPHPAHWTGPKPPKNRENWPITNISWFDAMRYAAWAGKRLPTEAEWEKAARGTDGRRFPWGNADDPSRRALETERQKLENVGARPTGASPYGALEMSGNAWEFTADWYEPYPDTPARMVQFGKKYKVMRGGGAEGYYGLRNPGTTTYRARILPYGAHDFVGFRCARSVNPAQAPYDSRQRLAEAESLLNGALRQPIQLEHEREYASLLAARRFSLAVSGAPGQSGAARVGVPLPRALLKDLAALRILAPDGKPRPTQAQVLARWDDGSARWALVEFPAAAGETVTLDFSSPDPAPAVPTPLAIAHETNRCILNTGPAAFHISREGLLDRISLQNGARLADVLRLQMDLTLAGARATLQPLPADRMDLEAVGPVRATVHLQGPMGISGKPTPFRYNLRLTATAGSPRLHILLTLTHKDKRTAAALLHSASLAVALPAPASELAFATDAGLTPIAPAQAVSLEQSDDLHFTILRDGAKAAEGTRSPGWVTARHPAGWLTLGVAQFWQNHPLALQVTPQSIALRLWSSPEPFEWEGGLAKTHELIVDFSADRPAQFHLTPLRAATPPAWACGAGALGAPMLPRGKEALERFPYWELFRESGMREWVRGMPTGLRHWGDSYLGGPYKGKNAYSNLEYDVAWNFQMEYLRTGDSWYLNATDPMARHQADIDTDHFTGQPWKHSPQHTTTEAELGHVFIRGMITHYLLTGDRRSLDAAVEVGDWIAATLEKGQGTGNERQIGWSLYALTGLYDVTRDSKYLHACETLCNRLLAGQAATGQFTNIRWDNRISFFNGIAMNGMLTVYQHNRDERLADGIMKVARRTLGMYPEYACRTLNAYIWAARRTNDPRFLDAIERTWELSTEYLPEAVTTETHAWHFRHFAAAHNLFPLFEKSPEAPLDPASWRGMRFERGDAEVYINLTPKSARISLMIVREGHAEGRVELLDPAGRSLRRLDLNDAHRSFEAASLALPATSPTLRLRLTSPKARAWQIHHDASASLVVYDPAGAQIPDLYPRAYGLIDDGATQVSIKFESMGEGFHTATLYDPAGRPVSTVRHFVDFEDPGRYVVELKYDSKTPIPSDKPWSIEAYKLKVISIKGILPYFSDRPETLRHPERAGPLLGAPRP